MVSDAYGSKHAVSFFGPHRIGEGSSLHFGLIVKSYDNAIDVVEVLPVRFDTVFYDEVSSEKDPNKDNVRLKSCPPPFSEVCSESDEVFFNDDVGSCYAVAAVDKPMHELKSFFTPVESEYEISDDDFDLVLNHLRPRTLQKDGFAELRKQSVDSKSGGQSDREVGTPVDLFGGGSTMVRGRSLMEVLSEKQQAKNKSSVTKQKVRSSIEDRVKRLEKITGNVESGMDRDVEFGF